MEGGSGILRRHGDASIPLEHNVGYGNRDICLRLSDSTVDKDNYLSKSANDPQQYTFTD
jgi:hypothetical protein